jgi:hypothetical protein
MSKSMTVFLRYSWGSHRARWLILWVCALIWPWSMEFAQAGYAQGAWYAYPAFPISMASFLGIPIILFTSLVEIGSQWSPIRRTHFLNFWPIDRREWALYKLGGALLGLLVVPFCIVSIMAFFAKRMFGGDFGIKLELLRAVSLLVPFCVWTMLWASIVAHRWVLLLAAMFFVGEGMAHGLVGFGALERVSGTMQSLVVSCIDIAAAVGLSVYLGCVFVALYQTRSRRWVAILAVGGVAAVDAIRAFLSSFFT